MFIGVTSVQLRETFSQELLEDMLTQIRKHTQIYKAKEYKTQDSQYKREVKGIQSRLEGIRRVKEKFLQEDETDKILDASEHT